tara:strand:- start:15 stop:320 length:306 start_codon:yes stop_codon:yes gene_type:complete
MSLGVRLGFASASHADNFELELKQHSGSMAGAADVTPQARFRTTALRANKPVLRCWHHRQLTVGFRYHVTPAATIATPAASAGSQTIFFQRVQKAKEPGGC